MLTEFTIEGFKSYRARQTLPLAPLTLLAGVNGSGKSNATEAIRMLSWLAQGYPCDSMVDITVHGAPLVRGTAGRLTHPDVPTFILGCSGDGDDWHRLTVELRPAGGKLNAVGGAATSHDGRCVEHDPARSLETAETVVDIASEATYRPVRLLEPLASIHARTAATDGPQSGPATGARPSPAACHDSVGDFSRVARSHRDSAPCMGPAQR